MVIPLQVLLDIMEFALDNTYIKDEDGKIFKQEVGNSNGGSLRGIRTHQGWR